MEGLRHSRDILHTKCSTICHPAHPTARPPNLHTAPASSHITRRHAREVQRHVDHHPGCSATHPNAVTPAMVAPPRRARRPCAAGTVGSSGLRQTTAAVTRRQPVACLAGHSCRGSVQKFPACAQVVVGSIQYRNGVFTDMLEQSPSCRIVDSNITAWWRLKTHAVIRHCVHTRRLAAAPPNSANAANT